MGLLSHFPVDARWPRHRTLVETGHGAGDSLRWAVTLPFTALFTIEINPMTVWRARREFKDDPRVRVILGESGKELDALLATLSKREPVLFWLDAHYASGPADIDFPLIRECEAIRRHRNGSDVIVIDDTTIQEVGAQIDPVCQMFGTSHSADRDPADHGYLILEPILPRLSVDG